jgi:hypothetical protein
MLFDMECQRRDKATIKVKWSLVFKNLSLTLFSEFEVDTSGLIFHNVYVVGIPKMTKVMHVTI